MTSFYSQQELELLGLKSCGKNVQLSRKTSIYGADKISIGDNSRIDDFCILSGNISIGRNAHIAAGCYIFAGNVGVVISDFVGISSRSTVYAESDDYSGLAMTNPTIPDKFRKLTVGRIIFERHVLIGTGCTVLPGVVIGEGASVGSVSLINKDIEPWSMNKGIPCKKYKDRSKNLLEMEKEFFFEDGEK